MPVSFPSEVRIEAAAVVVVKLLRAHPHIRRHTLRYFTEKDQQEFARRVARSALYAGYLTYDTGGDPAIALHLNWCYERFISGERLIVENGYQTIAPEPEDPPHLFKQPFQNR